MFLPFWLYVSIFLSFCNSCLSSSPVRIDVSLSLSLSRSFSLSSPHLSVSLSLLSLRLSPSLCVSSAVCFLASPPGRVFYDSLGSLGHEFESLLPLPRRVTLTSHFPSPSRFLLCGSERTHPGPGLSSAGSRHSPSACPAPISASPCASPALGLNFAGGGWGAVEGAQRNTECVPLLEVPGPSPRSRAPGILKEQRKKEPRRQKHRDHERPRKRETER